jgi:hypothetical protein
MTTPNQGYDPSEIENFKKELAENGTNFILNDEEENNEQLVNFFFLGMHEGREVIYDAVMYTLSLVYESTLYEQAEADAQKRFPNYVPADVDEDTGDEIEAQNYTEEVEVFIASRIFELEEEDQVQVCEKVSIDTDFGYGIGMEVALNEEEIDESVLSDFIKNYNAGRFQPDPTMYSFPGDDEEDEEEEPAS